MNPWGILIIALGVMLVIVGVKGSQHNVVAALTGHASANNTSSQSGSQGTGVSVL